MGKDLGVGDRAPGFKLPRDGGGSVSLADFKGKKLVLYFYPRADTPGCTREAIDFRGYVPNSPRPALRFSAFRLTR